MGTRIPFPDADTSRLHRLYAKAPEIQTTISDGLAIRLDLQVAEARRTTDARLGQRLGRSFGKSDYL